MVAQVVIEASEQIALFEIRFDLASFTVVFRYRMGQNEETSLPTNPITYKELDLRGSHQW